MGGCTTPYQMGGGPSSKAPPAHPATPFLTREDYEDRLGLAVQDVLENHQFSIPPVIVRGADSSIWFVAERIKSEGRFDRVFVRVNQDGRVNASITMYQHVGSEWPILGRFFGDPRPEAESIQAEVSNRLSKPSTSAG